MQIAWGTRVIYVFRSDAFMTNIGGGIYDMDTDAFRLSLKDLEDSEEGIPHPDTHSHNTAVTLSGVTYAHVLTITNGYRITFEDGQYAVNLKGTNNNIADVTNVNQVSLRSFNSAGLQIVETGVSGLTPEESADLATAASEATDAATDAAIAAAQATEAAAQATVAANKATNAAADAEIGRKLSTNKAVISPDDLLVTIYDDDGLTVLYQFDISEDKRIRTPV